MDILNNLDLLTVGITTAAIGILGFVVIFTNAKSATNRWFLIFSLSTIVWGISNYANSQFPEANLALWALRVHLFISIWYAMVIFRLMHIFPRPQDDLKLAYSIWLEIVVGLVSLLTLTPLVFSGIATVSPIGQVSTPIHEPGIIIFGSFAFLLVVGGLVSLIHRTQKASGVEKKQLIFVLAGILITFSLILIFNLLLPIIFTDVRFIPFGGAFMFPMVFFTAYAIIRHHLLNIKVIATEVLVFILAVVLLGELIFANDFWTIVIRTITFGLTLVFGIILIRSVVQEVAQREKIEKLAKDLTVSNKKLEKANDKLTELSRQKTEFVSIASHQLRAPLTAIKGYSSMVLEGSFGEISDKVRGAVERVFESSQRLVNVIEDFLDITRIELGKMKYDLADFAFNDLVRKLVEDLTPGIVKKGLLISFEVAPGQTYIVNGDQGKLSQVVTNVIDNAVKYTPKGYLKVLVSRVGDKIRLAVSDTGIGIAAETIPKLFEKFARADKAGETNIVGTGLGLYVAKQIVEAHGGKIWAESAGLGHGSTFIVELKGK